MLSEGRVVRIALDPPLSFTFCDDSFIGGGGITLCWPFHRASLCVQSLRHHWCHTHARKDGAMHASCTHTWTFWCVHTDTDLLIWVLLPGFWIHLDSHCEQAWLTNALMYMRACWPCTHTNVHKHTLAFQLKSLHPCCIPSAAQTSPHRAECLVLHSRMSARETEVHHIRVRKQEGGLNETEMMSRWVEKGTPKGTERDISSKTRKWVLKKTHTDRKSVNESETSQKSELQKGVILQEIPGESAWNWGGVMTRVMVDWRMSVIKYNQSERKDYLLCFTGVCNCSKKHRDLLRQQNTELWVWCWEL